mgnify:CR=1 FL=1
MSKRPRDFDGEDAQTSDLAPENSNSEQDDEGAQAQTVADEASGHGTDAFGLEDSEKVGDGGDSDDVQDLVDHMNQMVSSGRIDMDAYRGEPNFDDEDGAFGPGADEDEISEDD